MRQKGFTPIIILLNLVVAALVGLAYFAGTKGLLYTFIKKNCSSVNLELSLILPNDSWLCEVYNYGKEQKGWDGTIILSSQTTTIDISSLGRGVVCTPYVTDPQSPLYDPTNECTTSTFYSKNNISLETFKSNGQTEEIFGEIYGRKTSGQRRLLISIKWTGMETKDLTSAQNQEILGILDSITRW